MGADSEHRQATILAADVDGNEDLAQLVDEHGGHVVELTDERLLAEFPATLDAARCALAIQAELDRRNAELPLDQITALRAGVHLGEVRVEGERIGGAAVDVAIRLEALAPPGGICVSGPVHDQVKAELPVRFDDMGEQAVPELPDALQVWQMQGSGEPAPGRAARGRPRLRAPLLVGAAVLGLLASAGGLVWLAPGDPEEVAAPDGAPIPRHPSLVVRPFEQPDGAGEDAYLARGITEGLITDLSKLSGLFVIAPATSFSYDGREVSAERIARELGVRYVVEGEVQRDGDDLRIDARLLDTETGDLLWADRWEGDLDEVFILQDELARRSIEALRVRPSEREARRLARVPTRSVEAYESYLRARSALHRGAGSTSESRRLLRDAIGLDDSFADARALLARSYLGEWIASWRGESEPLEAAADLAQRAVELDPESGPALSALAEVRAWEGYAEQSLGLARRAVAVDPNGPLPRSLLAIALVASAEPRQALLEAGEAMRRDPRHAFPPFAIGLAHYSLYEMDPAIHALEASLDRSDEFPAALVLLVAALAEGGDVVRAERFAARVLRDDPDFDAARYVQHIPTLDPAGRERVELALRTAGLE